MSRIIHNAADVAQHLASLKEAAEEGAAWWTGVLDFQFGVMRKAGNGTQFGSVNYTTPEGVHSRLVVRVTGEVHSGQIMPLTEAGVAELSAARPKGEFKVRDRAPSLCVKKWNATVETADDQVTVLADANGNPILPGEDKRSHMFQVAELFGEAFHAEASERVAAGSAFVTAYLAAKKANKALTADAFIAAQGRLVPGGRIIDKAQLNALRVANKDPKDLDALTRVCHLVEMTKIASPIQEYISSNSTKNGGMQLPNPMTRAKIDFNKDGAPNKISFYDKDKPFEADGRTSYETLTVDGKPVTADNIHQALKPRSGVDGIVSYDSICFSSLGISAPIKADVLVVSAPTGLEAPSLDDVYGTAPPPKAPAAKAAAGAPVKAVTNAAKAPAAAKAPMKAVTNAAKAEAAEAEAEAAEADEADEAEAADEADEDAEDAEAQTVPEADAEAEAAAEHEAAELEAAEAALAEAALAEAEAEAEAKKAAKAAAKAPAKAAAKAPAKGAKAAAKKAAPADEDYEAMYTDFATGSA